MERDEKLMLAYLAGVLDGDGSFSIIKRTACMISEKRRIPRYRPCLQLYNLSPYMTESLQKWLGGNVGKRKGQSLGWQEQVYWYCTGFKLCKVALEKILPYLVVKKEVATKIYNFVEKSLSLYKAKKIPDNVIQDREKDYIEVRMTNDRRDINPESIAKPLSSSATEEDWAYIAGLMDSDGSFHITRRITPERKSYCYELRAVIQMLSLKGINFIYEKTGLGHVALITRGRGSNCRQLFHYRWKMTNHSQLKEFINKIYPYITYRKEQCKIILEYIDTCEEGKMQYLNPLREKLYFKIKQLNENGVYKPSLIDLEAQNMGNKGEDESRAKRLNEMDSKEYAKV